MGMAAADPQFHVLAVDDSVIDRKLIERLFKTSSCQVTAVDSGSKALEFLGLHERDDDDDDVPQEIEVDLIITDYCMPGMTGYDLLKKIKESASLRNIPVVIMSSENVPSRISRCMEEGAEEFFLKPVRLSDVNKLKPHMMKTKYKDPVKEPLSSTQVTEQPLLLQQEKDAPPQCATTVEVEMRTPPPPPQEEELPVAVVVEDNNKRKAGEENLSPERAKPRYNNGLAAAAAAAVSNL
ncbi:unnamed protein product [Cuscuta campestris]|uniref:Response regulatory domain-containing protein n=1 Tax=Cuscuta campestris TaxID=132261 RepID=A0A484MTI9_9ASTE|nr:unnamed protein product [Cuscuta campestris]